MLHWSRSLPQQQNWRTPWVMRLAPREQATLRLFCFPYAGAGAAIFRDWPAALPPSVDVCAIEPPGRFARHREAPIGQMAEFIEALVPALDPFLERPFALFGYSLGALMAFEFARAIRRRCGLEPSHLIVAAAKGPQLPLRLPPISHEPGDVLLGALERRYGAFEPAIKSAPDIFAIALKIMRVDLGMLENYRYRQEPPFTCPILAIGGTADPSSAPLELEGWGAQTTGRFRTTQLPGGHFFLRTAGPELRALVSTEIAQLDS